MNKPRIGNLLVVDDEIDTLNPLCDLLSKWGYKVAACTSGREALETLKKQDIDVLLTDLVMPEMDGIELILAAMNIDPHLVSIVITGQGTIQTAVEAMKLGAFDLLVKPLDFKMLRPTLSRAIKVRLLLKKEEKYRSIVEDQTELICRFLPDSTLTFVNEAYCRYLARKGEDMIGQSFLSSVPEEDREEVKKQIFSLNIQNPVETHENRVTNPDGEIGWQEWTNRALFDDHGNIIEYQSVGRDITDRKRTEDALQKSEARYRDLYDNAPDMCHTLDENGVVLDCNQTEAKMLGYEKREIIGKHITNFFTEESKRLYTNTFPQLKEKKKLLNLDRDFIRKDGTIFSASLNVFSVCDEEGRFIGAKAIARDITQLKQIEDALRRSEHKIRMITDNIPALVSYIDIHGRYEFVNARYEEWFGISRSELIGKHVREVLGDAAYNRIQKYIGQATSGNPVSFENTIPYLHGGTRWANVSYIPDIEEGGKVNGFYALVIDITERKKAEQALKEREKELAQKTMNLEELNTALKVLLDKRDDDKLRLEESILLNIHELVEPYSEKLRKSGLNELQKNLLEITASNLKEIVSSFAHTLSASYLRFTPTEIQIANLIKQGKTSKEISELLCVTPRAISFHRDNIRKKLGLNNKKTNLKTYLSSLK